MSKIYIASRSVISPTHRHLYLVFDEDGSLATTNDEAIIRGGPGGGLPPGSEIFGTIKIEGGAAQSTSADALIANGDNHTPADRYYTEVDLGGRDASEVWNEMVAYVQQLGVLNVAWVDNRYSTLIPYELITVNSNSTIHSVLSSVGIDLFSNMPIKDGERLLDSDFPAVYAIFGAIHDGIIDARISSRNNITSGVYDQGGNTTIKIKTNNEYNIWADTNFATQDVLQVQGYAGNAFAFARAGDDLLLQNIDNSSDTIATIKNFYATPALRINFIDKADASGAVTGRLKIALDTSNHYGWDAVTYAFAPGNEAALTYLHVKLDNGAETTKVFSGTGTGGYPANITKEDLTYLLQADFVIGNQMQTDYLYQRGIGALTVEQDAFYRSQLLNIAYKANSFFEAHKAQDATGVNKFLASESFLQSIRAWTLNKQADLSGSAEDRSTAGLLQQNLLTMYASLTGDVNVLAATSDYAEQAALLQRLTGFTTNAGQVYQETLTQNLPNAAALQSQYRGLFAQLQQAELTRLIKLDTNLALTEQQKYSEVITAALTIANELAFPATKLGYAHAGISTAIVQEAFTVTYGESWSNLYNNILGIGTIVSSGNVMSNWLAGTAGVNVLNGTAAANVLSGYGGNDTLNGGDGFDVLFGGLGNDLLNGDAANDTLYAGAGDDVLQGGSGTDGLRGEDGNDTLNGGAGVDQLTGGLGADVFKFGALTDSVHTTGQMDRIADFVSGTDKIDLTGLGFTGVTTAAPNAGQLRVTFDAYYNHTYVRDLNGTGFGFYLTGNHTTLTNADFIGLVPAGQTLNGTAGNNILQGSNADDVINGLGGSDQLFGNGGNDTLNGGAGVDQLTGGLGADVFTFAALTDSVHTTGQMDRIADFVIGTDKIDVTGLGFTGVTTGTPSAGQLKVSYDGYYNHSYVRDLTGGTGFGFYLTGNYNALTSADFIGLDSGFSGLSAASYGESLDIQERNDFSAYPHNGLRNPLNGNTSHGKTTRYEELRNSAIDNSVHNLINAMASFVPMPASGSKIEDLQRPQLYNDLASGNY